MDNKNKKLGIGILGGLAVMIGGGILAKKGMDYLEDVEEKRGDEARAPKKYIFSKGNKIGDLDEVDIIEDSSGNILKCLVLDESFSFKLSPDSDNEEMEEIEVDEISSIEVISPGVFKKDRPDEIKIVLRTGIWRTRYNYRETLTIYRGRDIEEEISFSKIKKVRFGDIALEDNGTNDYSLK